MVSGVAADTGVVIEWSTRDLHTTMLLPSTTHSLNSREIKAIILHTLKQQVKGFNPHCYWCVDFIFGFVLQDTPGDAVGGEVLVEGYGFFVNGFEIGGDSET